MLTFFGGIDFDLTFYESLLLFLAKAQIIEKSVNFSEKVC